MIRPQQLKKGDTVGIIAPSRMITSDQMVRAREIFADWGLEVKEGNNLFDSHGYFAGTDTNRLSDLQSMLDDEKVKAIFCARGGYGMTRIVDDINFDKFKKRPKWVIGFSDITALHCAISKEGVESIHGVMPVQYEYMDVEESLESLHKLLFDGSNKITVDAQPMNRLGKTNGRLIGGNLSLLCDSLGSATEIDTKGAILFLEEIDEYLYKVDRMLMQLKRAGKLTSLAGVIIGDFSEMKDTYIPFGKEVEGLIAEQFCDYSYPLAFGFPIGHDIHNLAVPHSRKVILSVTAEGASLTF